MKIGVIGGSGLYRLGAEFKQESMKVDTPFGSPSSPVCRTVFEKNELYFIARHGEGHVFTPTEVNYRANIFALKKLGVSAILSISAVGSLRKEIKPGDFVLPDQYIDLTRGLRAGTFFGQGVVGHAHFADPTCGTLRDTVSKATTSLGITCHRGGAYLCIEGPQFSTRAESHLYRSFQLPSGTVNVIGMTAMPEAKLAREAGLCYQTVAMATDYDCWNEEAGDVSVEAIIAILHKNVSTSQKLIATIGGGMIAPCASKCAEMMKHAVMSGAIPESRKEVMNVVLNS